MHESQFFFKQWCISICAMCGPLRNAWRDVESNNVEAVKRWNGQHTVHHGTSMWKSLRCLSSYLSVNPLLIIKQHVCMYV